MITFSAFEGKETTRHRSEASANRMPGQSTAEFRCFRAGRGGFAGHPFASAGQGVRCLVVGLFYGRVALGGRDYFAAFASPGTTMFGTSICRAISFSFASWPDTRRFQS